MKWTDTFKRSEFVNLVKLLLRASWSTVVIAVLMGGFSSGCAVGLIALIATALRQTQPPSLLALGGFIGLCCIQLILALSRRFR